MNGLRGYQQRDVERIRDALRTVRAVCYQLPTGGGKTVVAVEVVRRLVANGKRGLALVHRRELVRQFRRSLEESGVFNNFDIGTIQAGSPETPWASFQVASIQTLYRRLARLTFKPDLIIVDEAHHYADGVTWTRPLDAFPDAKVVGLTATPQRTDGRGLGAYFDALVQGPSMRDLVNGGHLAPCFVKQLPPALTGAGVRVEADDFSRAGLNAKVDGTVVAAGASAYLRYARDSKAIFFGASRKHSRGVAERLRAAGVNAVHVDANTPQEQRDVTMRDFATGKLAVLCNVDLFGEGVDVPECEAVLLGSPTKSITRYLQACGRAMRPRPGKRALVLDLAGISADPDMGLPDEPREWTLSDADPEGRHTGGIKRKPQTAALRKCGGCLVMFEPTLDFCPACGAEYDGRPDLEEIDVELVDAKPRARVPRRKGSLTRRELMRRVYATGGNFAALDALRKAQGYSPNWSRRMAQIVFQSRQRGGYRRAR